MNQLTTPHPPPSNFLPPTSELPSFTGKFELPDRKFVRKWEEFAFLKSRAGPKEGKWEVKLPVLSVFESKPEV